MRVRENPVILSRSQKITKKYTSFFCSFSSEMGSSGMAYSKSGSLGTLIGFGGVMGFGFGGLFVKSMD